MLETLYVEYKPILYLREDFHFEKFEDVNSKYYHRFFKYPLKNALIGCFQSQKRKL